MKIVTFLLSIFLIAFNPLIAQNYLWPTNASRQLSSSFGEYRSGHFHSGIDIKTNYHAGYPVFAVADGYVWRVRTSPFGYGKAIYIKHDDGNLSVYGHLDEFNPFLNAYVRAEQMLQRRYRTDIYFRENEFRVARGDTIAYTGETGSQHPHLHFEIRDPNHRLINPLNTNLKIYDPTIPTIQALAVVPINNSSRIDGQANYKIFDVAYIHQKLFRVTDTITVTGPVGIELKAHDTVRGVPNFYNPYGIRLFVADSLFFHVQYDSFDFDETHLINRAHNFQLKQRGFGNFQRLWFNDHTKNLRFYAPAPGDGILRLGNGFHAVKIEVYDKNMNTSALHFTLRAVPPFEPKLKEVFKTDQYIDALFSVEATDSVAIDAAWVNSEDVLIEPAQIENIAIDSAGLAVRLAISNNIPNAVLKTTLRSMRSNQKRSFFFNSLSSQRPFAIAPTVSFIHNHNTFLCQATFHRAPTTPPTFYCHTPSDLMEIPAAPLNLRDYISNPIPLATLEYAIALEWRYNESPENILRIPCRFKLASPGSSMSHFSADSTFSVLFDTSSVYDTLATWIIQSPLISSMEFPFLSELYTINPVEQPLKADILVELNLPTGAESLDKIGVYQLDDDKWKFLDNTLIAENGCLRAKTNKLGSFALIKDRQPPEITDIFPGNSGRFRARDIIYISAIVKDQLSGIKDDTAISVMLNDRPLFVEYNAPKDQIRYKIAGGLPAGQHTLKITVVDNANNQTTRSSTFTVY
ncbi:MAG TPA: M23 family metallopeptidase [Candidatus Marinimicrobia bacterium]|nr:M23 family metallopeptidase [Candidatus Neomarinimicrobiota bacterium]